MLGIISAIGCGLSWGVASFSSGRSSRSMSAPLLTAIYNFLGVIFFGILFLFSDEGNKLGTESVLSSAVLTGIIGGLGFALGLACIAHGMSKGRAGIIGPLVAIVSIIVPIVYIATIDELPNNYAMIGIALLLIVPYLSSRTHKITASHVSRTVGGDAIFGLLAGAGFGIYYVALIAAPENAQLFMLMIIQFSSMIFMLAAHKVSKASWSIPHDVRNIVYLFLVSELFGVILLRASLNLTSGAIVSAVSGSIDPVGILILSRIFNKELFTKPQLIGFGVMVLGIVLVTINS